MWLFSHSPSTPRRPLQVSYFSPLSQGHSGVEYDGSMYIFAGYDGNYRTAASARVLRECAAALVHRTTEWAGRPQRWEEAGLSHLCWGDVSPWPKTKGNY